MDTTTRTRGYEEIVTVGSSRRKCLGHGYIEMLIRCMRVLDRVRRRRPMSHECIPNIAQGPTRESGNVTVIVNLHTKESNFCTCQAHMSTMYPAHSMKVTNVLSRTRGLLVLSRL